MKKILIFSIAIIVMNCITAQNLVTPGKPYLVLDSRPGYVTINEISAGKGLSVISVPYSRVVFDVATIHGYQINKNFITALGTGFSVYNGGGLLPLFADIRYRFNVHFRIKNIFRGSRLQIKPDRTTITPYLFTDGGALFPVYGIDTETKLFISSGFGLNYTVNRKMTANLGAGLFSQFGNWRDSFIKIKLGMGFRPGK